MSVSAITSLLAQITERYPPLSDNPPAVEGIDRYEEAPHPNFLAADAGTPKPAPSSSPSASVMPASSTTAPAAMPAAWLAHMQKGGVVLQKGKAGKADTISVSLIKPGLDWNGFKKNIIPHPVSQYLPKSVPVSYEIPKPATADEYYLITEVSQTIEIPPDDPKDKPETVTVHYPTIVHARFRQDGNHFYFEWDTVNVKDPKSKDGINPEVRKLLDQNIGQLKKELQKTNPKSTDTEVKERLAEILDDYKLNVKSVKGSHHYDKTSGLFVYSLTTDLRMPRVRDEKEFERLTFGPAVITASMVVGNASVASSGKTVSVSVMVIREATEETKVLVIP